MAAPTPQELEKIIEDYAHITGAVEFGQSLVFEEEQIEGTRYKYTFTTHSDYMGGE